MSRKILLCGRRSTSTKWVERIFACCSCGGITKCNAKLWEPVEYYLRIQDEERINEAVDSDDEQIPDAPTLEEMMDDLNFEDSEMLDDSERPEEEESM